MTADIDLNFGTPIPKAEAGTYPALCVGIDPFVINEGQADQKTLLRWDFSLDGIEDPEVPGANLILDGASSLATGPKSKNRAWVTSILGHALDEQVNLTTLRGLVKGKPCLVRVEIKDGYSKVADVLPPMRQPARPAAPAPVAQPGESPAGAPLTALPNQVQPGDFDGAPKAQATPDREPDPLAGDLNF